jgi:hypothetical protein
MFNEAGGDPFDSDGGRQLLERLRRDCNRKAVLLGYPVRLNLIRWRKTSWDVFKIEPLLLFTF